MTECDHLKGRPWELCTGIGRDGRPNPTQSASDAYRAKIGLEPIVVAEPQAKQISKRTPKTELKRVSKIGTNLAKTFHDIAGAIPCGDCKAALKELDSLTTEQVQAERDSWVKRITANTKKAAPRYWQKVVLSADQFLHLGGTEYLIGMWLDEACNIEVSSN